ncbi:30S ribosome-binding factor RbfA [Angelakisella massiliensis]|uniref:30S ribosome-binding factor RbfA n=1 Tax=Angelakisella massiliensis TaxID=1871018 RepID=UPI0008F805D8|nr:30S ribosome-binding factor RbfA [Angelakisella massiliensis]
MVNFKNQRLNEDIRRELTDIFRSLKDPRIDPMLSIVKVDLARDQSYCKVYVSSLSGMERARESVQGLVSATGFIRRELGIRLEMRRSPELKFVADDSIEHSADIARKLNEIHSREE